MTASSAATSTRIAIARFPGAFGGVIDGTGTSAFGNQTIKTNAFVGGWTQRAVPHDGERSAHLVVALDLRCGAAAVWRRAAGRTRRSPASITNPLVAGGLPGITIDGYFGGSGLGRLGSPDFLPKFQHTNQFEYLDTLSWLHGNHAFKFGADIIAPMKNQYMDVPATRGSLRFRNAFTGNPDGRLPARLRRRTSSSRTSGSSSSGTGRRWDSCRTTGRRPTT